MGAFPDNLHAPTAEAMRIRFIKPPETHLLRQLVLRPGQPLDEMEWPQDEAADSFHLAMEDQGMILAVASFQKERHERLLGWKQFRIRGMATHPDHQGKGIGTQLLRFGLDHLRAMKADLVWCNARSGALRLYAKEGFAEEGGPFVLEGIGEHYLMYKRL